MDDITKLKRIKIIDSIVSHLNSYNWNDYDGDTLNAIADRIVRISDEIRSYAKDAEGNQQKSVEQISEEYEKEKGRLIKLVDGGFFKFERDESFYIDGELYNPNNKTYFYLHTKKVYEKVNDIYKQLRIDYVYYKFSYEDNRIRYAGNEENTEIIMYFYKYGYNVYNTPYDFDKGQKMTKEEFVSDLTNKFQRSIKV